MVFRVHTIVVVMSGSCPELLFEQFVFSLSVVGSYSRVPGWFSHTPVSGDFHDIKHLQLEP